MKTAGTLGFLIGVEPPVGVPDIELSDDSVGVPDSPPSI